MGSAAKRLGKVVLGQIRKRMIWRKFVGLVRPESGSSSESHSCIVVQILDRNGGVDPPGAEPGEDQRSVLPQHLGHFLHRLDALAHSAPAPALDGAVGLRGRAAVPQGLESLLDQVGAHGVQVVFEEHRQM